MNRFGRSLVAILALMVVAGCGEDDDLVDPLAPQDHTFVYVPHADTPDISAIFVRGTFNNWTGEDLAMTKQADGSWEVTLELEPGTYQYKYVFNDPNGWASNMCADPTWGNPPGGPVVPGLTTCDPDDNNNAILVID